MKMDPSCCTMCQRHKRTSQHYMGMLLLTVLSCLFQPRVLGSDVQDIRILLGEEVVQSGSGHGQRIAVLDGIPDQTAYVGKIFTFKVPDDAFKGPVAHIKVEYAGRASLPDWLVYDARTRTLEGLPGAHDEGDYMLQVTAESSEVDQVKSVARCTFTLHIIEDAENKDTTAVPLSAVGFQPIKCSKGSPVTMATIIIDADYSAMGVKHKTNMMRKLCSHLDMPVEILKLLPVGNKPIYDSSALVAGPGDVKKQHHPGVLLQWEVGCGNVNARQMQVLQQVETNSQDGKMSQAVGAGVLGWHVTNNKVHKVQRMKRQVYIRPTATLLPTVGPPTGRPVATRTIPDTGPTDEPESRTVPTMATPTIIAPSKTHGHKLHRTKTKGRHWHKTKEPHSKSDRTMYYTATLTPTMGIKPTKVVEPDMMSTLVIDDSMGRVTPTVIEPSPGISRTVDLIEPSIVPTKPTDSKATEMLPSRTFTAPVDTHTSQPVDVTRTETTPEATQGTPMLPPFTLPKETTPIPTEPTTRKRQRHTKKPKPTKEPRTKPTRKPKTPVPANFPPMLQKHMERITLQVGDILFKYIPVDTFTDQEDGNTRDLTLTFSDINDMSMPPNSWVKFDMDRQLLYGMPLWDDAGKREYLLKAADQQGEIANEAFEIFVRKRPQNFLKTVTHEFSLTLDAEFSMYILALQPRFTLAQKLSKLFGDRDPTNMQVTSIKDGSVIFSWTNKTLNENRRECPEREIGDLIAKLVHGNNDSLKQEFINNMKPNRVKELVVTRHGPCEKDGPGVFKVLNPDKDGSDVKTQPSGHSEEDLLITTIVPAVVIAAMLILTWIIACVLYRKQRKGKLSDEDQHTFIKRGVPIIFQDELDDKPCPPTKPLILEDEKPPMPPPEYHRSGAGSYPSTPPSDHKDPIDTTEDEHEDDLTSPLYPPPPPLSNGGGSNRNKSRPHMQQSYKSPPPYSYVPP